MPNFLCKSLTTRYQRGHECQTQSFKFCPKGPKETLRVFEQKTDLKLPRCRTPEMLRAKVVGSALAGWLSQLEHRPVHQNAAGSIFGQGT